MYPSEDAGLVGDTGETRLVVTTQKLQKVLQQREFHLAELIDEVVYAEECKDEAIRGNATVQQSANELEGALQQLIHFHVFLTEEVIMPTLLDAVKLRLGNNDGTTVSVLDSKTRHALQALAASPSLSRMTQQLVRKALAADAEALRDAVAAQPSAADTPGGNRTIEQAIVLSGTLWRKQRELLADLDEIKQRLEVILVTEREGQAEPHGSSPSPGRRGRSAEALMSINRHLRRSSPSGDAPLSTGGALVEAQEQLLLAQRERELLWERQQEREKSETVVSSLLADKRQLENELLYAQRRTLEEQNRNRDLKQRVQELQEVLERTTHETKKGLVNSEAEIQRISRGADVARASLESEVARLRTENQSLVESNERLMQNPSSGETQARHRAAKLEGIVSSLKTDLQIVESRLAVIQEQREAERQRILYQHDREKQRLRTERDECQQLIDKMAVELRLLSQEHQAMRGAASVERM